MRAADAYSASPSQVAGPKGRVARRGEALVLSDAETGSFGGAWNARRDGARRRQRTDVVLRVKSRVASAPACMLRARPTRDVRAGVHAARAADASSASPAQVAGPKGRVARRGEALVLSDAETGSFGGAWNARRNGARRRQRATDAPSSTHNKRAVVHAQQTRRHQSATERGGTVVREHEGFAPRATRAPRGVELGMRCVACG